MQYDNEKCHQKSLLAPNHQDKCLKNTGETKNKIEACEGNFQAENKDLVISFSFSNCMINKQGSNDVVAINVY